MQNEQVINMYDYKFHINIEYVKKEETILWMFKWVPRTEFGIKFIIWLISKIMDYTIKSRMIRNILEGYDKKYNCIELAKMIGQGVYDPISIYIKTKDITWCEPDILKIILCKFLFRDKIGCTEGINCTFSHHPSMIWKKICNISTEECLSCEFIPKHKFGLVFQLSKDFERAFNVRIIVPRKEQNNNDQVKIIGANKDIITCVKSLKEKLSTIPDREQDEIDKKIFISIPLMKINWDEIGKDPNDPIFQLCKKRNITEKDNTKAILYCHFFRNRNCIHEDKCKYSHHPEGIMRYSHDIKYACWTTDEFILWGLCYSHNYVSTNGILFNGKTFREKLIERIINVDDQLFISSDIIQVINAYINWQENKHLITKNIKINEDDDILQIVKQSDEEQEKAIIQIHKNYFNLFDNIVQENNGIQQMYTPSSASWTNNPKSSPIVIQDLFPQDSLNTIFPTTLWKVSLPLSTLKNPLLPNIYVNISS